MEKTNKIFPGKMVFGFFLSIVMTVLAAIVFYTDFTSSVKLWIIGALAIFQAGVQLIMFMHMNEGKSGMINTINIVYSVFIAAVIVAGSIWILSTGHAAHY
ncbi:cytochrome aa3 quinol oxidase subunit IV [Aquibacillus koreensis]|uniref:Quinol oxidase subunit 4 n=1 Tax=Aquibacillus koreensis TaxID=279446 RepID=A0A9X3WMY3_9BACI|nr:cytochrome aa3 quinol oxidase subunit IV [Aquibacillus koreensis]MCT2535743.1 cytochrome aa3 quinol oxidase subunit IV [Aquibacillus koreensis]MDC3420199.1 cytochrome aa3 quinol oxidase subunit IV [Aquibacillus koreensis]